MRLHIYKYWECADVCELDSNLHNQHSNLSLFCKPRKCAIMSVKTALDENEEDPEACSAKFVLEDSWSLGWGPEVWKNSPMTPLMTIVSKYCDGTCCSKSPRGATIWCPAPKAACSWSGSMLVIVAFSKPSWLRPRIVYDCIKQYIFLYVLDMEDIFYVKYDATEIERHKSSIIFGILTCVEAHSRVLTAVFPWHLMQKYVTRIVLACLPEVTAPKRSQDTGIRFHPLDAAAPLVWCDQDYLCHTVRGKNQ